MTKLMSVLPLYAVALGLAALAPVAQAAANPDKLWQIVSQECLPNEAAHGNAAPCKVVDPAHNYVMLKDRRGIAQYLLIPATRVSGIDSEQLLQAAAPSYFASAWGQRHLVEDALGRRLPRNMIGVEINSAVSRSQLQLHLHVDCLRADLPQLLNGYANIAPDRWTPITIDGQRHRVMRLVGADLNGKDPFKLAATITPAAPKMMGALSLLLAGATFSDGNEGFYLIANAVDFDSGTRGDAEAWMDHDCR